MKRKELGSFASASPVCTKGLNSYSFFIISLENGMGPGEVAGFSSIASVPGLMVLSFSPTPFTKIFPLQPAHVCAKAGPVAAGGDTASLHGRVLLQELQPATSGVQQGAFVLAVVVCRLVLP